MKRTLMRLLPVFMAALMVITALAGCLNNSGDDLDTPEFVFLPDFMPLPIPEGVAWIDNLTVAGESLYFTTMAAWDENNPTFQFSDIYAISLDGSETGILPNYNAGVEIPSEAEQGNIQIYALSVSDTGDIWVAERGEFFNYPDSIDDDDSWEKWNARIIIMDFSRVRRLDNTGAEISSFDISYISTGLEWFHIYGFAIDSDNNIYIGVESKVYVLDSEGRALFDIDVTWVESLVNLQDGSVALSGWGHGGRSLSKIDIDGKRLGETLDLPANVNAHKFYPGNNEYSILFTDGTGLYGLEAETGEVTLLLTWIDSDMTEDGLGNIMFLPDGRILLTSQQWNDMGVNFEIIFLTKTPYSELPERIVLTLATYYLDWDIRSAVVEFNRTSTTHRIQVTDYSEFNTDNDWGAGLTRLSTEIIAGNVPDILDVTNLPFHQYVAKDLLVDLYALIDSDPDLSRSDFMENVLRATEIDGGLYKAFPLYNIITMLGNPSVVGSYPGWNMEEFKAVIAANPDSYHPLGQGLTKMNLLQALFMFNMNDYVNWNEGTVNFDSNEFIALLEYANTLPDDYDWDNYEYISEVDLIRSGRQIIAATSMHDFRDYQMYKALFGGDIVFKGLPAENRNGFSLNPLASFAITSKCKDVDGAWSFIRTFLMENWQSERSWQGLPVNKNVFDKMVSEAMKENEHGNSTMGWDGFTVEMKPLTQADLDKIMAVLDSVNGAVGQDEVLWNIISESASSFFGGAMSVQDAVRVIQNRASIYVAEQS